MKTSTAFSLALLGFAAASPVPQDIDFDSYDSIPTLPDLSAPLGNAATTTIAYAPSAAASSAVAAATDGADPDLAKRGSCNPESAGNGPTVSPDTADAFLAYPAFATAALTAKAPAGFFLVAGFQNLQASASDSSYQTYISSSLTSYDPAACAAKCNTITGCSSFNIYFERDPSISVDDSACPTASSVTRIKCAFFGAPLTTTSAKNVGQYTGQFHVVIAGSNSYTTAPQPQPGYSGPVSAGNASIISPTAANTYMGVQSFAQTQPFDPSVCAAACTAKSDYNTRHAAPGVAPRLCEFFDAYILYKNGINGVFTCTYYTTPYDVSYAKNFGQYNSAGDHFTIGSSYLYTAA